MYIYSYVRSIYARFEVCISQGRASLLTELNNNIAHAIYEPNIFPNDYITLNAFLGTFKLYIELCFPGQKGTKICQERARSELVAILIFTQISHNPIG